MINKISRKYWKKAKKYILHGTMLLSKHPNIYLPGFWPTYYKKAKDCWIWDLDNNKYLDMCSMGIGTNILGYQNKNIDLFVKRKISNSNMSTLNCPEEVDLSKKLVSMHPWSSMAKLCRTGAEASSIALRIAKCNTKNDKIAFCGYHGWHDWYLSANLTKKNSLKKDHLKGLSTKGVTKKLKGDVFNFKYNDIGSLENLIKKEKISIVIMEVERNIKPQNNFLKKVRSITSKNKIILIFDECTSGFRENYGGLHKKYKVYPDIAIFGKALGNGYAINAVLGRKKIMKKANNSFMSSTFWTERIGPSAALATLKEMQRVKSWNYISKTGKFIKNNWLKISKKYNIDIKIYGLNSICTFEFKKNNNILKTYLTQEFLKNKILANTSIYVSTEHKKDQLEIYFRSFDKIFNQIANLLKKKKINRKILKGKLSIPKFERLN